jgi:hypothetical protein
MAMVKPAPALKPTRILSLINLTSGPRGVPEAQRKSFIDIVVYRTGDQIAWSVALLRWLELSTTGVALVVIPIAALWLANALWLGRRQEQLGTR